MTVNCRIALKLSLLRAELVCADDWVSLRAVDADGALRGGLRADGLAAAKMLKYAVSDDGKNGQI